MSKPVKVTLAVLGSLFVLLIVAALVLPMVLNVDALKSWGEERASAALGREVRIDDVGFALWTGPRVQLKGFSIDEAEGSGEEPFASFESLDLRVRFLPVLRGRFEVQHIVLVRPKIRIARDASGRWNFDDITGRFAAGSGAEGKGAGKEKEGQASSQIPVSLLVDTIRVEDGDVHFRDGTNPQLQKGLTLRPVTLGVSNLALDRPVTLSASVGLTGKGPDLTLDGTVGPVGRTPDPSTIPIDLTMKVPGLDLSDFNDLISDLPYVISGTVQLEETLEGTLKSGLRISQRGRLADFRLASREGHPFIHRLSADMEQEGTVYPGDLSVHLDRLLLRADEVTCEAKGQAKNFIGIPTVDLSFQTNSIPLERWIEYFPDLEARVKASGDLAISGSVKGTPNKDLVARVEAVSSRLEMDRGPMLLEEASESDESTGEPVQITEIIPPDLPLTVTAKLSVKEGRFEWVNFRDYSAQASAKKKQLSLDNMELAAFGGRIIGSSWINMTETPPGYGSDIKIQGIEFNDLLTEWINLKGVLYGKLTADMLVSGVGNSIEEFKDSVIGVGSFRTDKGRFTSANILSEAGAAASLLGLDSEGKETEFDRMDGRFTIRKGKVLIEDLQLSAAGWSATASGEVGLDQSLNMSTRLAPGKTFEAKIPADRRDLLPRDDKGRLQIPLRVKGTLTSPKFSLDSDAMEEAAKQRVKRKVEEKKEEVRKDLGEKLEKDLGDALKKLF